jgi:hypothetical protein
MWCFLSVFLLSTLHSINLWSYLPSLVFAWGQARSKLGGDWYVHFASLFCIIIYSYSLIYFIFRDDTYVVPSVFTCLMIVGGFAAGVRILLEKGPSRYHILKIRKIPEKIPGNYIFPEDSGSQKEESRGAKGGPHARVARPAPWPRQPCVRPPWPTSGLAPSRTSSSPKT